LSVARPGHGRNGGLPSLRARGQRLIRTLGETHVGARADAAGARWLLRSPLAEVGGAALSGLDRVVDDPDVLRVGLYVVRYLSLPSALVLISATVFQNNGYRVPECWNWRSFLAVSRAPIQYGFAGELRPLWLGCYVRDRQLRASPVDDCCRLRPVRPRRVKRVAGRLHGL